MSQPLPIPLLRCHPLPSFELTACNVYVCSEALSRNPFVYDAGHPSEAATQHAASSLNENFTSASVSVNAPFMILEGSQEGSTTLCLRIATYFSMTLVHPLCYETK